MSDAPKCPQGADGMHDWAVAGSSADGHRLRCRQCQWERSEAHSFTGLPEPGIDFYTVVANHLICGVCGYQTVV